jgi:hypothetical protein
MKYLLKSVVAVVLLMTSAHFVNAQCPQNRTHMCKIENCHVLTACVPKGLIKQYLENGWNVGICKIPPGCGTAVSNKGSKRAKS